MKRVKLFLFLAMLVAVTANGLHRQDMTTTSLLCASSLDQSLCPGGVDQGDCTNFCNNAPGCSGSTASCRAVTSSTYQCRCTI